MNHFKIIICLLILSISLTGYATESEDIQELTKIASDWENAVQTKNLDRVMSYYSEGAKLMMAGVPVAIGKEKIRPLWKFFLSKPNLKFSYKPTEIVIAQAGDMAWESGEMVWSSDMDPEVVGKYLVVWKRSDGIWKAVVDMSNADISDHG